MTLDSLPELLRVPPGPVDLRSWPTGETPGFDGDKDAGKQALAEVGEELAHLQEQLFSEGSSGGEPARAAWCATPWG